MGDQAKLSAIHKIVDKAAREGRDLTPAEKSRIEKLRSEYDNAPKRPKQWWR